MFNIIQQFFNKTFNTANLTNTSIPAILTLSTAPTTTPVILLLLFIIILISAIRKRGYTTTTINHVFKCHLLHYAIMFINTHVYNLQTYAKPLTKRCNPDIIITVHDTYNFFQNSFLSTLTFWGRSHGCRKIKKYWVCSVPV